MREFTENINVTSLSIKHYGKKLKKIECFCHLEQGGNENFVKNWEENKAWS